MEIILLSDNELVQRTLSGESSAYEALFERHRSVILSMLHSKCCNDAICDDILQESFIKAYLNLEKFDSQYSFAQWLLVIARNLFIDYIRRNEIRHTQNENEGFTAICEQPNPEERYIVSEDNRRLNDALKQLPAPYRTIVEMRFWRDMSYEQISQELHLPLGTVKTQIHRARRAFITLLG